MTNYPTWEKRSDRYFFTFHESKRKTDRRKAYTRIRAYRVVREGDIWRADLADAVGSVWTPWEALTSTEYPTIEDAKAAVETDVKKSE